MFGLGTRELVIIAIILVLLFGAKKIPELANAIGEAIRNLRRGFKTGFDDNTDKKEIKK